jgi:hypothetical protein
VRTGADHGSGARDLGRRRVRPELKHASVQAEQRDPVREHVVHLTRDPGALGVADLLGAQLLLRLNAACAFAQRLAAAAAGHAPGDDYSRAKRAGEVIHRQRGALGPDGVRQRQQRHLYPGDQACQLPAPVGSDRIERNGPGQPGRRRDHHDRHRGEPDCQRPAPPPPQGKAGNRRAGRVDDEHRAVQPVPNPGARDRQTAPRRFPMMHRFFAATGRFAVRFRWAVVAAWVAATVLAALFLPSLASVSKENGTDALPASSPSLYAVRLAAPFQDPNQTPVPVVVARGGGTVTSADITAIGRLAARLGKVANVQQVKDLGVSADRQAVELEVLARLDLATPGPEQQLVTGLHEAIAASALPRDLSAHLAGPVPAQADASQAGQKALSLGLGLSIVFIVALLLLVFRALLAPLLTLAPALLVTQLAGPVIGAAGKAGLPVSPLDQALMLILTVGAGTDYGLFLVFRVREELRAGRPPTRRSPVPWPGSGSRSRFPPPPSSPRFSPCCWPPSRCTPASAPRWSSRSRSCWRPTSPCCRRCLPSSAGPRSGRPAPLAAPGGPAGGDAPWAASWPIPPPRWPPVLSPSVRWPPPCSATGRPT